jgi:hypothetical protein
MADFKLNDILLMGHQTWVVVAINDEFMELKAVNPNAQDYFRMIKVMLNEAWKWNIYTLHEVDLEQPLSLLTKEQMEDLLA